MLSNRYFSFKTTGMLLLLGLSAFPVVAQEFDYSAPTPWLDIPPPPVTDGSYVLVDATCSALAISEPYRHIMLAPDWTKYEYEGFVYCGSAGWYLPGDIIRYTQVVSVPRLPGKPVELFNPYKTPNFMEFRPIVSGARSASFGEITTYKDRVDYQVIWEYEVEAISGDHPDNSLTIPDFEISISTLPAISLRSQCTESVAASGGHSFSLPAGLYNFTSNQFRSSCEELDSIHANQASDVRQHKTFAGAELTFVEYYWTDARYTLENITVSYREEREALNVENPVSDVLFSRVAFDANLGRTIYRVEWKYPVSESDQDNLYVFKINLHGHSNQ